MSDEIWLMIAGLCSEARANGKVFLFGDEVYTPDEAECAMLEHADEELQDYGGNLFAYIGDYRLKMVNP